MDDNVWARDPTEGFILGRITELMGDEAEVIPINPKYQKRVLPFSDIFRAQPDDQKVFDDNCEMMFLNEGSLLNNIRLRYYKNKIYSYVANILIAVNPYKDIPELYDLGTLKSYQGQSLGKRPPHVFALADKAYRDMKVFKQSQAIIVSGESGAGKTESTKHLLKYLCESWGAEAGDLQKKILDANPVLEAFGNAKTTRNNNSSRFGKFIEVHFDRQFRIAGGFISHYLLEKSRICSSQGAERSYHIFYMLMAGAPDAIRDKLQLTKPDDFNYLKQGCTQYFTKTSSERSLNPNRKSAAHAKQGPLRDILLDDVEGFRELDQALARMGVTDGERLHIYATVAAVLHLGNIEFEDDPADTRGGCRVATDKEKFLMIAAKLLEIDSSDLRQALVSRVMQSSRGGIKGTVIMVPLKLHESNNARDALAKAIYSNLFDYIVNRINKSIPFQESSYYIGILDIAGFEFFTVNSFEQFCINYCNEKLQQFFNQRILIYEQDLYKREGLSVPEITFTDNQDCIDIIETKNRGILQLLDEESKLPKPSYMHFSEELHKTWAKEFRLGLPRSSKLKVHRSIRDDEGFVFRHFAGAVCYQTNHFIDKNNDALHASLEGLIQESKNKFVQTLFSNSSAQKGKLTFISVGNKFKTQLGELMEKLQSNGTNFIRCIKPNNKMVDQQFDGSLCLMQLKCSGMTTVLELMEHGFPSRTLFADLYAMYEQYLPKELKQLPPKIFCEAMLHSLNLHDKDYKFGITRVFFRPGKFAEFDKIMKSDPENLKSIIGSVKKWLVKSRWIKAQFCALAVIKFKKRIAFRQLAIIDIQRVFKGYLVRRQHGCRIKFLQKIKALDDSVKKLETSCAQLKDKEGSINDINKLKSDIVAACALIRTNENISPAVTEQLYTQLVQKADLQMATLQKKVVQQKNAEEQARLKKIQEELEREKRKKEEEEARFREEEDNRRRKAEMEAKRKVEEEQLRKQEELDRKKAADYAVQRQKDDEEERKYQEQLEQERQDHELALRLAQESNGQLEESPPVMRKAEKKEASNKGKYDLSTWKYSELRDTINTSCEIDLLEACRHEFHRRLKVYHAWKAKNRKRTTMEENERAPRSVLESAARTPKIQEKQIINNGDQRYFRIPFQRPGADQSAKGWWYAHFDGQYVARQMELSPEKSPVLLIAGTDDMQMCELSLEETGLTRKRGAEILENDFNREWVKNGGLAYTRPADRKK